MPFTIHRELNEIIAHCSDSDHAHHDNIECIRHWHINENHWTDIGYHFVILKSGVIKLGRPLNIAGAHCKNHNFESIGICLTGKHRFSMDQYKAFCCLCNALCNHFNIKKQRIFEHNYYDITKSCPNFDADYLLRGWPFVQGPVETRIFDGSLTEYKLLPNLLIDLSYLDDRPEEALT